MAARLGELRELMTQIRRDTEQHLLLSGEPRFKVCIYALDAQHGKLKALIREELAEQKVTVLIRNFLPHSFRGATFQKGYLVNMDHANRVLDSEPTVGELIVARTASYKHKPTGTLCVQAAGAWINISLSA